MADSLKEAQQKAQTKIHTPGETSSPSGLGSGVKLGEARRPRLSTVALFFIAGVLALISLWVNRPSRQDTSIVSDSALSTQAVAPAAPQVQQTPLPEEAPKSSGLILKGVVIGGEVSYAMVNDEILSVGDSLGGYTVSSIQNTYIVVQDASGDPKRVMIPHEGLPTD